MSDYIDSIRRNVTVTRDERNGYTVETCIDHDQDDAVSYRLFDPSGWYVNTYKTERGLTAAIARVTKKV